MLSGSSNSSRSLAVLVECWVKTECEGLLLRLPVVVINSSLPPKELFLEALVGLPMRKKLPIDSPRAHRMKVSYITE